MGDIMSEVVHYLALDALGRRRVSGGCTIACRA